MYVLVNPFLQIAFLRYKPQDLPASLFLLKLTLIAHAVLGVLMFTSRLSLPQAVLAGDHSAEGNVSTPTGLELGRSGGVTPDRSSVGS